MSPVLLVLRHVAQSTSVVHLGALVHADACLERHSALLKFHENLKDKKSKAQNWQVSKLCII